MIKILVVEDDNEIRQLLKTFLEKNGYKVVTAKNGIDGLHLFEKEQDISLLLLDIMLPYKGGDGLLSDIRRLSDVPVIMISAKSMVQTKVDIMRMGADDYITKPFDLDEVLVRIEALLRRSALRGKIAGVSDGISSASGKTYTFKNLVLNTDAKQASVKGNVLNLTAKEYGILELMLSNPKKLFSKANLFESVWNEEYVPEDSTLKVHISNLRTKLKEYDDDEYLMPVFGEFGMTFEKVINKYVDDDSSDEYYDEGIGHKIGGYPYFTQTDPRWSEELEKYDYLLFQLDTDDDDDGNERVMWGDSGIGNFFIRTQDLKNCNFSDVLYNWDCC